MKAIEGLIKGAERVQAEVSQYLAANIRNDRGDMLQQVKYGQLYNGVDGDGNSLKPSYLEDSWFHTRKAASNYADWKNKITRSSKRKREDPNLFINGKFYSTLNIEFGPESFETVSDDTTGRDIIRKYGKASFGVSKEYLSDLIKTKYAKQLTDLVKSVILGNK